MCISVMGPDTGGQNHKYFCGDPRAEAKNSLAKINKQTNK